MRFWFDTEFIEDGKIIDLISIGIVSEDGKEYYAEFEEADYSKADPWLHENVIKHLKGPCLTREVIKQQILEFVGEQPEFWAYYADYDWVALCQLFGRMTDLPKTWPMFCMDVKQYAVSLGNPEFNVTNDQEHHALADAKWTKEFWHFCNILSTKLEGSK